MSEPQSPPNDFAARLQARIALLEQQNAALQQEQAQLRQAEQKRVAELAKVNNYGNEPRSLQFNFPFLGRLQ